MFNPTDSTPVIATSSVLVRVLSVHFSSRQLANSSDEIYFVAQHRNLAYQSPFGSAVAGESAVRWDSSEYLFHNILKESQPIGISFNKKDSSIGSVTISLEGLIPSSALVRSRGAPPPMPSAAQSQNSHEPPALPTNAGYHKYSLISPSGSDIGTAVIYLSRIFFPSQTSSFELTSSSSFFVSKNKKQQIKKEQEYLDFTQGFMNNIFSTDLDDSENLSVRESMSSAPVEAPSLPVAFMGTSNVFGISAPHPPTFQRDVYTDEDTKKRKSKAVNTADLQGSSPESRILQLINLLKDEVGRQIFIQQLIPQSNLQYSLSQTNFLTLSDVIAAGLRQASNTKDFYFCKILLDQSLQFYSREPLTFNDSAGRKLQHVTFLYSRVKQHEVFRRPEFWNLVFLDAFPYERKLNETIHSLAVDNNNNSAGNSNSNNNSSTSSAEGSLDWICVRDLLMMIAGMQFAANMDFDQMIEFMKEQSQKYRLPQQYFTQLNQFYQIQWGTLKKEGYYTGSATGATTDRSGALDSSADSKDINHTSTNTHKGPGSNIRISALISNFTCLGEYSINKFDDVGLMNISPCWSGMLHVTNYQLIFLADDTSVQTESRNAPLLFIPLGSIHKYEFVNAHSGSASQHSFVQENSAYPSHLTIYTKDLRTIVLGFRFDLNNKELWEFVKFIKRTAFTQDLKKSFAFIYKDVVLPQHNGWIMNYSPNNNNPQSIPSIFESEVKRMNITGYKLYTGNQDFKFIPTYPSAFLINQELTDDELNRVKQFRSKGRIPALTFKYSRNGAMIFRSAQPNVGLTFGRCQHDEKLLQINGIRAIFDARPKANAVANQAKGGGYENTDHYTDCKIVFLDIHNIHVMRESLNKLYACMQVAHNSNYNANPNMEEYYIQLHASGWMRHVRTLLIGAFDCAATVSAGQSILIHCSDGWDRTAQLTSLTQIILDPFYRTRTGFSLLVTKEWLEFGHQFNKRSGHCRKDTGDHERSPIFIQFLDCMFQLISQFPTAFEFNENYIAALAEHLYSNKFGTFLHNNEKERAADKVKLLTVSVFTELNKESNANQYVNTFYQKSLYAGLRVNTDVRAIQLWPFYYRENRNISRKNFINNEKTAKDMLKFQDVEAQLLENLLIQQANELNELRKKLGVPTQPLPNSYRDLVRAKGKLGENQYTDGARESIKNTALRRPKLTFSSAAAIRPPGAEVQSRADDSPPGHDEPEVKTSSTLNIPPPRSPYQQPPPLPPPSQAQSFSINNSSSDDNERDDELGNKPSALLMKFTKAAGTSPGSRSSLIAHATPGLPRRTSQRRGSAGDTKQVEMPLPGITEARGSFKSNSGSFLPASQLRKIFQTAPPAGMGGLTAKSPTQTQAPPPPIPSTAPLSGIAAKKLAFQQPPPPVPNRGPN